MKYMRFGIYILLIILAYLALIKIMYLLKLKYYLYSTIGPNSISLSKTTCFKIIIYLLSCMPWVKNDVSSLLFYFEYWFFILLSLYIIIRIWNVLITIWFIIMRLFIQLTMKIKCGKLSNYLRIFRMYFKCIWSFRNLVIIIVTCSNRKMRTMFLFDIQFYFIIY